MRVGVDTSVWINYLRHGRGALANQLDELLDQDVVVLLAPVELELLLGSSSRERVILAPLLGALKKREPNADTWEWCRLQARQTRSLGVTLGATDLLIAGLCAKGPGEPLLLWTLDQDFLPLYRCTVLRAY